MTIVRYRNKMARGQYELVVAPGRVVEEMRSLLTPREMLRRGVFGGCYLNSCRDEYPKSWFRGVDLRDHPCADANAHGVLAGQSLSAWRRNGWIRNQHDPRGWFEWYSRYWRGRRCEDDERQIGRWRSYVPRHLGQARKNPSPKQLQALLQWGIDTEKLS